MTGKDAEAARGILADKRRDLFGLLCMGCILQDQCERSHRGVPIIVPRI